MSTLTCFLLWCKFDLLVASIIWNAEAHWLSWPHHQTSMYELSMHECLHVGIYTPYYDISLSMSPLSIWDIARHKDQRTFSLCIFQSNILMSHHLSGVLMPCFLRMIVCTQCLVKRRHNIEGELKIDSPICLFFFFNLNSYHNKFNCKQTFKNSDQKMSRTMFSKINMLWFVFAAFNLGIQKAQRNHRTCSTQGQLNLFSVLQM